MKKMYSFFLCIAMMFFCVASENQERLLQAHQAYDQGKYADALRLYESIQHPGPALWYNMGNCFYALHKDSDAVACWRRAQKNANSSIYAKAEHNSTVVKKKHNSYNAAGIFTRLIAWLRFMSMYGSLLFWQLLFLGSWSMFIILLSLAFKKVFTFLVPFVVSLGLLGSLCMVRYGVMTDRIGIVNKESALYIGSDERFSRCGSVHPLHEVRVIEKKDRWYKVSQDKVVGWIPADTIILV